LDPGGFSLQFSQIKSFALLTLPRPITSIRSSLGEWRGKILSTPIPYEIFLTVKVERMPPPSSG